MWHWFEGTVALTLWDEAPIVVDGYKFKGNIKVGIIFSISECNIGYLYDDPFFLHYFINYILLFISYDSWRSMRKYRDGGPWRRLMKCKLMRERREREKKKKKRATKSQVYAS